MDKDSTATETPTFPLLVLGMPRTGTTTLRYALQELGYLRPYSWRSMSHSEGHTAIWEDFLEQKYFTDIPLTREDFDVVLKGYTNAADWPVALFAEDLIKAYPDAKIILSVRDSAKTWHRSFKNTIWANVQGKLHPKSLADRLLFWQPGPQTSSTFYKLIDQGTPFSDFEDSGEQWYCDHNEKVRNLGAGRVLEFNCKEGWEPLCSFLGKEVPPTEFPTANGSTNFNDLVNQSWSRYRVKLLKHALIPPLYIVAMTGVAWTLIRSFDILF